MSLYKLVVFAGAKGSGKSSLIKALFPELDVRFDEPSYYRDYPLSGGVVVREVAGRHESLDVVSTIAGRWRISVGVLVADASQPFQRALEPKALVVVENAERKCLVAAKADSPYGDTVARLKGFAGERGFEFFAASVKDPGSIEELRLWVLEGRRPEVRKPEQPRAVAPPVPVDLVPVPAPKAPGKGALSEEELAVFELCDGKRGLAEIARITGKSYGEVKRIADSLMTKGFIAGFKTRVAF
ncbi:GTPase domain-containing protein [Thermofilum pendens]|uniref:Uncharacterized protein n=1 Tax=Thermofilum pendens (strain DSM 2475 / Hrk 5) TaxID=368408 RepID=A1RZG9_THEPD|nr:GTPase domain-containing protein [Thermofilum pendens]ABL78599.1 hypothetical protein Tpen_1201 [Thermofilum pendens Hrk 5]